jgi:sialic acid synthase SpsE
MILSTGAATIGEIDDAVESLRSRTTLAILHCVSSYPTDAVDANLRWIGDLSRLGLPVGYSDHATEVTAGALAVAAGATIVEKHLTYDTTAAGPDHSASFDPAQFAEYVRLIRLAERMRGASGRRVLACERDVRAVSRQGLVVKRPIAAGQTISLDDLTTQRPGDGVGAAQLESIVGQTAAEAIPAGTMLKDHLLPVVTR